MGSSSRTIGAGSGSLDRHVRTLFTNGSFAGLTDGELLSRFVERDRPGSEAAFAAIVDRHGPTVRRCCRSVLGPALEADADDAFQAVFLLLARKARSLRVGDSVAPWLVEASFRIARKARVADARRRKHEANAADRAGIAPPADPDRLDDHRALREEIDRLPPAYRSPILLCALEGRSAAEAARLLGVAEGTIHSRLSRARERLRSRLSRRGQSLALWPIASPARLGAIVPERLVEATVRSASALAAGRLAAGEIPSAVLFLIASTSRRTLMHATLVLSIVSAAALGPIAAGWNPDGPIAEPPPPIALADPTDIEPDADPEADVFHVRIVEADGSPAPDAIVRVLNGVMEQGFRNEIRVDDAGQVVIPARWFGMMMVAERPASAPDAEHPEARPRAIGYHTETLPGPEVGTKERPITIRLRPITVPITVQIVDEAGDPVPEARVFARLLMDRGIAETGIRPISGMTSLGAAQSRVIFGDLAPDKDGMISFLAPEGTWVVLSASARHLICLNEVHLSASHARASIVLKPAGGLQGIVTDADSGEPVAGVVVSVTQIDRHAYSTFSTPMYSIPSALSGPDGRFVIEAVPQGVHVLRGSVDDGSDRIARDLVGVRVEAGRDAPADLQLIPARHLSGVAVSKSDGTPCSGMRLKFSEDSHYGILWGHRDTELDSDGRFGIDLPPGTYRLTTILGDHQIVGGDARVTVPEDRDPEPIVLRLEPRPTRPQITEAHVLRSPTLRAGFGLAIASELTRGISLVTARDYWGASTGNRVLRGRVVDDTGTPIAGVRVWTIAKTGGSVLMDASGTYPVIGGAATDRDGQFILPGLPEGPLNLGLYHKSDVTRRETVDPGVTRAEFVLPRGR